MLVVLKQRLSTFPEIPSFSVNEHPVKQVIYEISWCAYWLKHELRMWYTEYLQKKKDCNGNFIHVIQ